MKMKCFFLGHNYIKRCEHKIDISDDKENTCHLLIFLICAECFKTESIWTEHGKNLVAPWKAELKESKP